MPPLVRSFLASLVLPLLSLGAPAIAAQAGSARVHTEDEAFRIGWPALHGPFGNLLPLRTGIPLLENLAEARLAWVSEDRDFGTAKTGSQTFKTREDVERRLGPEAPATPGNWAGVIVAEGLVFSSSFRAAGPVFTADRLAPKNAAPLAPFRFRIEAEDLLIALDARTGRPAWKAVEPGGLLRSGGKREGFQVAPACHEGRVFALGSTGRLFAYDAASGRRLWQSDIGPAHAAATREREAALAAAAAGRFVEPAGPAWHTSLVAVPGVVVAPTYAFAKGAPNDTGLAAFSAATGEKLWEVPAACSRHATPALWWHAGRPYLLAATWTGRLHLIDPSDGKLLWTLDGLGPTAFTLAPSPTHVMLNVAPKTDPKAKRQPGRWGAIRLSLERGEIAWSLPDEPALRIPTWFDTCARQRALIRDARVYLSTEGDKAAGATGVFLLLDENTGRELARHENGGSDSDSLTGLFYLAEDQLLVRADSAHGASHGGRHPILAWSASPGQVRRLGDSRGVAGLDLLDFTTAYEVHMELPLVAGRLYERTADGRLACYDLRRPDSGAPLELALESGVIGLGRLPLPVRLPRAPDGRLDTAILLPPSDQQAGVPYGRERRDAAWLRTPAALTLADDGSLSGRLTLGLGASRWDLSLSLPAGSATGAWTREVAPLPAPVAARGALSGKGPFAARSYLTPWLKDRPVTTYGELPAGSQNHLLVLEAAITLRAKPAALHLALDHDGRAFVRAIGTAFSFNQAWHEVDASALRLEGRHLQGEVRVVLHPDSWVSPREPEPGPLVGAFEIDATLGEQGWQGTYSGHWGVAARFTGAVLRREPD